jgi:2-oxoglutarate dehydrogenase complex dehydrogenase (E1) component-like enzyme
MSHRGRLATITVLNDYPFRNLINKVKGNYEYPEEMKERGEDIPTHIAPSNKKKFTAGGDLNKNHEITLSMIHNPSHLESHNALSMGKSKAKIDDL